MGLLFRRSAFRAGLSVVGVAIAGGFLGCGDDSGSLPADGHGSDVHGADSTPLCEAQAVTDPVQDFFVDISDASGMRDENFDPDPVVPIPINDHSRLAFADINGDGYDDIVMHSLFPNPQRGIPFEHLVFVNNRDRTFTNFSDDSGLRDVQAGFFAFGDVDNDGDLDCFAGYDIDMPAGSNTLLLNDGEGRFTVRASSGVEGARGQTVAGNAVFADFDGDANIDLFVGRGQTGYAAPDSLYLGNGDGSFRDQTRNLSGNRPAPSNGSVACDYDNDGDLDLFVSVYGVSHDRGFDFLYENDGMGRFRDVAIDRGFASFPTGNYYLNLGETAEPGGNSETYMGGNGFGLDCGDVNRDGLLDIFITQISHPDQPDATRRWSDPTALLINQGSAMGFSFANEFLARGLPFNEGDVDGAIIDFDNDGRLDLSVSRDRKYEVDRGYPEGEQRAWFGLFRQLPSGMFDSLGVASGINDPNEQLRRMKGAQNHAWADIDRDGDLDLLVGGRDQGGGRPNFLFDNTIGSQNNWVAFELEGDGLDINRDAIGARISIRFSDYTLIRELHSSRGMYNSIDTWALHFGLGDANCSYTIEVRWPNGRIVMLDPAVVGQRRYVQVTYPDTIE